MPQRLPEIATVKTRADNNLSAQVKTRSLAASLNGELVFLFSVQKLLFVQDFRSFSLHETHLSVFLCGVLSRLTLIFLISSLLGSVFWRQLRMKAQNLSTQM